MSGTSRGSGISQGITVSDIAGVSSTVGVSCGVQPAVVIGGLAVGTVGTGIYAGYTLSGGDDFQTLDLISAANPHGKYFTTRTYSGNGGARAPASGGLAVMHDVSPDYTGWQDSNRGIPVASFANSHQIVAGEGTGALRLMAIRQSASEQALLNTGVSGQVERTAMISGASALWWDSPAIIEFRARMPTGPHGQHPSLWALSAEPPGGPGFTGNEYFLECGNSKVAFYHNKWSGGSLTNTETDINNFREGNFHTYTGVLSAIDYRFYVGGALLKTVALDPDGQGDKADHMLITHHILNSIYQSQTYTPTEWDPANLPNGVVIDIEWFRVWRLSTAKHYEPLRSLPDEFVLAGSTFSVVLPSQASLWGEQGITEYVTCVQNEVEEPDGSNTTSYSRFPAGISYDGVTRTLSGTMPSQAGALYVVIGVKGDGNTCVPAKFRLCAAPVYIGSGSYSWTVGAVANNDIYSEWDVGRLFRIGSNPKGLAVTGLPPGLYFDAVAGRVMGNAPTARSGTLTLNCMNSVGQITVLTAAYTVTP